MFTFEQTKAGYAALWDKAKIYSPRLDAVAAANRQAGRILALKTTFQEVEQATGVPWWMIGAMLYREADLNVGCYLGNGQSLKRRTTVVPIGRGPFSSFLAGARDAIRLEGMPTGVVWTIELSLYWTERFNGFGYYGHGCSPYVWNWTDQYHGGKFVADHDYRADVWDVQGGCAAIIKQLAASDGSIVLAREGAAVERKPPPPPAPVPTGEISAPPAIAAFQRAALADLAACADRIAGLAPVSALPATQEKIMNPVTTSPVTSSVGSSAIGIAVAHLAIAYFTKDWSGAGADIGVIIAGAGLLFAKDGHK